MWASFTVYLCDPYAENQEDTPCNRLKNLVDTYLAKSMNHPLELKIQLNCSGEPFLLRKLVAVSFRWRHVTFETDPLSVGSFPCLKGLSLPILETLIVQTDQSHPEFEMDIFSLAPNLRRLGVSCGVFPELTDLGHRTLLKQINTLWYTVHSSFTQPPIEWFPSLRHLGMLENNISGIVDDEWPTITVPITSLFLRFKEWEASYYRASMLQFTLTSLIAPDLSELTLREGISFFGTSAWDKLEPVLFPLVPGTIRVHLDHTHPVHWYKRS